jgi:hypothetical protein
MPPPAKGTNRKTIVMLKMNYTSMQSIGLQCRFWFIAMNEQFDNFIKFFGRFVFVVFGLLMVLSTIYELYTQQLQSKYN